MARLGWRNRGARAVATQTIAPAGPAPQESGEPDAGHPGRERRHRLWRLRDPAASRLRGPARRDLCHHGRQRLRQDHGDARDGRAEGAGARPDRDRRHQLLGGRARGARAPRAQLRHRLPERRLVELDDACRERRPAARRVHGPQPRRNPGRRGAEARPGRPRRLRGLLSLRDQRRHAQAGRGGSRAGARSELPVLRRAFGGPRPGHLFAAWTT